MTADDEVELRELHGELSLIGQSAVREKDKHVAFVSEVQIFRNHLFGRTEFDVNHIFLVRARLAVVFGLKHTQKRNFYVFAVDFACDCGVGRQLHIGIAFKISVCTYHRELGCLGEVPYAVDVAVELMVAEFRHVEAKLVHHVNHRKVRRSREFVVVWITCTVVAGACDDELRIDVAQTVDHVGKTRHVLDFSMHVVDRQDHQFLLICLILSIFRLFYSA